jgi:hypothetical protein
MTVLSPPDVRPPVLDAAPLPPQKRRKLGGLPSGYVFNLVGAVIAGISIAALLDFLTALSGPLGLVLVGYVAFLVVYGALIALTDDGPVVRNAIMTVLMATCAVVAFGALGIVVFFTIARGWAALVHANFYTQDMSKAGPLASLKVGGMGHALVGTLWMVGIAVILTVPIGLVAAVYLDVTRSRPARFFRTVVEAMTALPSILAGLFIYAAWILEFGFGRSGLAAALALSVMMLPYIIRAADLALRLVPGNLREASDRPSHRRGVPGPAHCRLHQLHQCQSAAGADGLPATRDAEAGAGRRARVHHPCLRLCVLPPRGGHRAVSGGPQDRRLGPRPSHAAGAATGGAGLGPRCRPVRHSAQGARHAGERSRVQ